MRCRAAGLALALGLITGINARGDTTTQPASAPATSAPTAGRAPLADELRGPVMAIREHLGLTTHSMRSMGCSYETSLAVFSAILEWLEPRRALVQSMQEEIIGVRSELLAAMQLVASVESKAATTSPASQPSAIDELEQARQQLRVAQQRNNEIQLKADTVIAPLVATIRKELSPMQSRFWDAARTNSQLGLPMQVWHVPGLTPKQVQRIKKGEALNKVLTGEQRHASAIAQGNMTAFDGDVRRAEAMFFFGRELPVEPPTSRAASQPAAGFSSFTGQTQPASAASSKPAQ